MSSGQILCNDGEDDHVFLNQISPYHGKSGGPGGDASCGMVVTVIVLETGREQKIT